MIISTASVKIGVPLTHGAEFTIGENGMDVETSMPVDGDCGVEMALDGGDVTIIEGNYGPESELSGQCDKERLLVDVHNVDNQCETGVRSSYIGGDGMDVVTDVLWLLVHSFTLKRRKVGTPYIVCDLDVLGGDRTVWEIIDDLLTHVLVTRMHDDVL